MKTKRSLRATTSPRLRQKLSWKYVAAGIALSVFIGIGVFFFLNLGNGHDSKASTAERSIIYSKATGNWSDAASWNPRVPTTGDSIVILEGNEISLNDNIQLDDARLVVYGTLWINQAKKLNLQDGSVIEVFASRGKIDGYQDNSSAKINYDNTSVWNSSMEPIVGYSRVDEQGLQTNSTLPVELVYFRTSAEGRKVISEWATASELNNDYFTIERSTDGRSFEAIGTVEGSGNSSTTLQYSYTDENPLSGTSYYRLKQTDYDGKFEYFQLAAVEVQASAPAGRVTVHSASPNPFSRNFEVNFELDTDGPVEVRLMNMQGKVVVSEIIDGYMGSNRYSFTDQNGLIEGIYLLNLVQNNTTSRAVRLIKK